MRLTTTNKDLSREMICRNEDCGVAEEHCPHLMEDECACLREVINKLAAYEDAEEQGLLLRLPCKVGDTVYIIQSNGQIKANEADMMFLGVMLDEYGKEWFTTEAEAEAALVEKGGAE